jgi:hypothetical protein
MTTPSVIDIKMAKFYIDVRVSGDLSVEAVLDLGRRTSEAMREHRCPRILIDLTDVRVVYDAGGDFGFLDRILSASFDEISIAVVTIAEGTQHVEATVNYLDTSHATAEVFASGEAAKAWLSSRRAKE